jgi:cysteine synthase A
MMAGIVHSIEETIGNTPLLELKKIEKKDGIKAHLLAKLEFLNPGGSIKDRVALQMVLDAEEKGLLKKGAAIIEPTSGNTGIGLALVGASRGYSVHIVMPDSMSKERILTMKAYGAKVTLTPGILGMKGAIAKAEELKKEGDFIPGQFDNPSNPKAHRLSTGPEIWRDTEGKVDILVAGVGTGGTITGIGGYLKEKNPKLQIIAVEPATSAVLSGGKAGKHGLQGIGAGFIPSVLDTKIYNKVMKISDEEAYEAGRRLGRDEGFLCGISSGAALAAALKLANEKENEGKNIVVILPDSGDRYLSTTLFED